MCLVGDIPLSRWIIPPSLDEEFPRVWMEKFPESEWGILPSLDGEFAMCLNLEYYALIWTGMRILPVSGSGFACIWIGNISSLCLDGHLSCLNVGNLPVFARVMMGRLPVSGWGISSVWMGSLRVSAGADPDYFFNWGGGSWGKICSMIYTYACRISEIRCRL